MAKVTWYKNLLAKNMNRQKIILTSLTALTVLLILSIGLPVKSKKLSSFKSKAAHNLISYADSEGNIVADLKGLKKNEVPFINLHTISDIYFIGDKYGSSVDFGALEELAELKPTFRGQNILIKIPSKNIKQPAESFKVLTAAKAAKEIVALLGETQLLVPSKKLTFKNDKQKFDYSQFDVAVSDTFIFTKLADCYQSLTSGKELFSTCRDYVSKSPFTIDYNPETLQIKFKPTYSEIWTKYKAYSTSFSVSYGRISGAQYAKGKIPVIKKSDVKLLGAFELDPSVLSDLKPAAATRATARQRSVSPDYQAPTCGGEEGRERIDFQADQDIDKPVGGTLCKPLHNGKWSNQDFNNAEEAYQQGLDKIYAKCHQTIKDSNNIPVPDHVGKCPGCPNGGSGCTNPDGDGSYNLMQTTDNYKVNQTETGRDEWNVCYSFTCEVPDRTEFPVRWTCNACEESSSSSSSEQSSSVSSAISSSSYDYNSSASSISSASSEYSIKSSSSVSYTTSSSSSSTQDSSSSMSSNSNSFERSSSSSSSRKSSSSSSSSVKSSSSSSSSSRSSGTSSSSRVSSTSSSSSSSIPSSSSVSSSFSYNSVASEFSSSIASEILSSSLTSVGTSSSESSADSQSSHSSDHSGSSESSASTSSGKTCFLCIYDSSDPKLKKECEDMAANARRQGMSPVDVISDEESILDQKQLCKCDNIQVLRAVHGQPGDEDIPFDLAEEIVDIAPQCSNLNINDMGCSRFDSANEALSEAKKLAKSLASAGYTGNVTVSGYQTINMAVLKHSERKLKIKAFFSGLNGNDMIDMAKRLCDMNNTPIQFQVCPSGVQLGLYPCKEPGVQSVLERSSSAANTIVCEKNGKRANQSCKYLSNDPEDPYYNICEWKEASICNN